MSTKKPDSRCQGRTKTGARCRAFATPGGLCYFHANPNKASELGRIGGSKKGRAPQSSEPLPTVDNVIAVRDLVARLIADVHTGKLDPKVAAGMAPLMNLQLRAIETIETLNIEMRLAKVEEEQKKRATDVEKKPWV
jgi:hypothetical protein